MKNNFQSTWPWLKSRPYCQLRIRNVFRREDRTYVGCTAQEACRIEYVSPSWEEELKNDKPRNKYVIDIDRQPMSDSILFAREETTQSSPVLLVTCNLRYPISISATFLLLITPRHQPDTPVPPARLFPLFFVSACILMILAGRKCPGEINAEGLACINISPTLLGRSAEILTRSTGP